MRVQIGASAFGTNIKVENIGMSPSGKALDFDSSIRQFKSGHPSQKSESESFRIFGTPSRTRTGDTQRRRLVLYPTELLTRAVVYYITHFEKR